MKSLILPVFFLIAVSGSSVLEPYLHSFNKQVGENCDESLTDLEVQSFDVTPWPPKRNTELKMNMKGVVHRDVAVKSIEVEVLYNGYDFYHESFPDPHSYKDGETAELSLEVFLPVIAPPGRYEVQVRISDDNAQALNCWQIEFSL
jgi:hypothetical protein